MNYRDHRAPVWVIWGLIGFFGLVEATAWILAGGIPRRPGVLVQVGTAWVVMVILASLATRRLRTQAQRIKGYEHTHQETLRIGLRPDPGRCEIIARSVDATLAFQALASRIARWCRTTGCFLLTERAGVPDLQRACTGHSRPRRIV